MQYLTLLLSILLALFSGPLAFLRCDTGIVINKMMTSRIMFVMIGLQISNNGAIVRLLSKLTKIPGNKFYQSYIKIRLHSIGKFYIAKFLILLLTNVKSQMYML